MNETIDLGSSVNAPPALDVDALLADIAATETSRHVVVMAETEYISIATGRVPISELTYLWPGGPLEVGDMVLCPPTPWMSAPFKAIVVSLDASDHPYKGPVKTLLGKA